MRRFYHYGSQTVLFFGEIFVPGLSVPYLTICQLSHFPSQRRPFHKIDFFYLLQRTESPFCASHVHPVQGQNWTNY